MTEPGNPDRLAPESAPETTGTCLPTELPTRRSLRAQRDGSPATTTGSVPAQQWPTTRAMVGRDESTAVEPVAGPTARASVSSSAARAAASGAGAPPRGPASTSKPARRRKNPLGAIVALVVVPGLFLTVALPAYAFAPTSGSEYSESGTHELAVASAQEVDVSSSAAKITVARDGYTAVSGEEIRRQTAEAEAAARAQAAAELAAQVGTYSVPAQRQEGDDYPWPGGPVGVLSPLNYEYRECVDFVAWRLNRDAGATGPFRWVWSNLTPGGGSAWNWANAWYANGWQVSHDPIVGSVAWFTGNHVAYVQSVNGDGTVTIEEYNQNSDHNYHRRTIGVGDAALYLYPPPA
nr:CHAP domain-containing protein [Leifsonia sp. Leaf325]